MKKLLYILLCLFIIFTPMFPYNLKIGRIPVTGDIILFLIFLVFAILSITNFKDFLLNVKDFIKDAAGLSFIVLFAIMLISFFYSTDKHISLDESLRFLTNILLYFIVKYEVKDDNWKKQLINSFMLSLFAVNIFGLIQIKTGIGLPHEFYRNSRERISAAFGNPNSFGAFLILGIFPVIIFLIKEKQILKKTFYIALFLMSMINIYYTSSRNAVLAFIIGCIVLIILFNWKFSFAFIFAALLILVKFKSLFNNILKKAANSALDESRIKLWKTALQMIKNHPILGVGNGNYVSLYNSYIKKYPKLEYADYRNFPCHNSYLKIESELGIVGGISFASLLISIFVKCYKAIKVNEYKFKNFFIGFFASIAAFYFMNLSDNLFFVPKVVIYFWIFAALADSFSVKKTDLY